LLKVEEDWLARLSPVVLALSVATHEKVDEIFEESDIETDAPLQIVDEPALVIVGRALTVTVTA
jgi:hypothetical protein